MDTSPSSLFDELDEPVVPNRSPSRLDFCMDSLEQGDDPPTHEMDWGCTSFRDGCPYTFIDEDAFIASLDHSRLPIVDPPQDTDSPTHKNADTSHAPPAPPEHPTEQVVVETQAPIPVRPPSVQLQVDAQEFTPPPRTAAQRLNYPHHGFSRSALLQQKTFWNSRHEEWVEWQLRMEQGEAQKVRNDAYTGLATPQPCVAESPPPYMRTSPSGLERDLVDLPPRKHEQDVHSSIYPRVGDISALRDPYTANIDRCFFRYPLWTLHKALYVFNMHQRTVPLAPSASISSSTLSSYTSSTSEDDEESDSTLVADDSPVPSVQRPPEPSKSPSSLYSPPSWSRLRGWERSWYARWELLISIFQRDQTKCDTFDMSMKLAVPPESKADPSLLSAPIFRFTIGGDEENDDDDDDDDDDYGTQIIDSSFRVDFEEECERAMAFYSRESKCLEMGL